MKWLLHPAIGAVAILASACSFPGSHATVHWKHQPPPEAAPLVSLAQPVASAPYAEFCSMAAYPRTLRVWQNASLLQEGKEKSLRIYLGAQRGVCLVDGQVAMDFPVCTGTNRHPTPTGRYRIIEKHVHHWSNLYDCPMPYWMRLTYCGIGLHVGEVYRRPASHGCIRLTREACEPLFHALPGGTRVEILD